MHDVEQANDRIVLHLFEERDLSDRRRRHTFILCLEPDLLQRDDRVRLHVLGSVDDALSRSVSTARVA